MAELRIYAGESWEETLEQLDMCLEALGVNGGYKTRKDGNYIVFDANPETIVCVESGFFGPALEV